MTKKSTSYVLLSAILGGALVAGGCKGKGAGKQADSETDKAPTAVRVADGLCPEQPAGPGAEPDPTCEVLATVNGVPITLGEVEFSLMGGHGMKVTPEMKDQALDKLIEAELAYQRALELGLDKDPKYRIAVRTQLLRLGAFKRNEMLRQIMEREVAASVNVGTAEAQKYFDEHTAQVRSEFHLLAIRFKDRAGAEKAVVDLRGGASFEELAKTMLPPGSSHGEGGKKGGADPWDLGWVAWKSLPRAWGDAVSELEPGAISDVVAEPRTGIQVFKLVERRENPDLKLDDVKNAIMVRLRDQGIETANKTYFEGLAAKATVVRTNR